MSENPASRDVDPGVYPHRRGARVAFGSHATAALAIAAIFSLSTLLLACAPAKEAVAQAPQARFARGVYDCVVHYASYQTSFRLDLAFETARTEGRLDLRVVDLPLLSDPWPESLPLKGWQRFFEKDLTQRFVFDTGPGSLSSRFGAATPWRFREFAIDKDYESTDQAIGWAFLYQKRNEEAVVDAIVAALSVGAGCADLEAAPLGSGVSGPLLARVEGDGYLLESRTVVDTAGLIDARAISLKPFAGVGVTVSTWWLPELSIEISRRDGPGSGGLAFAEPARKPWQRFSTQGWRMPRIDGSTATIPLTRALYKALLGMSEEEAAAQVVHNKTHQAYMAVIEGWADIAFVTEPSAAELAYAESEAHSLSVVPIAREAFVFIVNARNPIRNLALEDIRSIYRGDVGDWKALPGGGSDPIAPYIRPANSGSQTLFEKFVLGAADIRMREYVSEGMGDLVMAVGGVVRPASDVEEVETVSLLSVAGPDEDFGTYGGLGYTVYYYLSEMMANPDVKLIAVDGVFPEEASIVDGSYPLLSAYYAVTRSGADLPPNAKALLEWLGTRAGEAALREANYIPWSARPTRG